MYAIKTLHRVVGGISTAGRAPVDKIVVPGTHRLTEIELPKLPGIGKYARALKRTLQLDVHTSKITKRVEHATYEAIAIKDKKMKILPNDDSWYITMRALHKAHKDSIKVPNYGKAALTGFVFEVLQRDAPTRHLRGSSKMHLGH
jgi:hypothetical protein